MHGLTALAARSANYSRRLRRRVRWKSSDYRAASVECVPQATYPQSAPSASSDTQPTVGCADGRS